MKSSRKRRAPKSRVRGLIIMAASMAALLLISLGVKILRDEGYQLPEIFELAERLAIRLEGGAPLRGVALEEYIVRADVLDVGQGSSLLIQASDGKTALIDTGEQTASGAVCGALRSAGTETLDFLIITHPHTDHFGGAIEVLEQFEVGELWLPDVPEELIPTNATFYRFLEAAEKNGCELLIKEKPETLRLSESVSLSLLDGFADDPSDLNDTSLALMLRAGEFSLLITGDGEKVLEQALLEGGERLGADVLIAGHHGSSSSSSIEFLNAVSPKACVVSVGRDNEYNLPSPKALERLSQFGNIYRTDINGAIAIATDGNSFEISADNISETFSARR